MAKLKILSNNGSHAELDDAEIQKWRGEFHGELLLEGNKGYDDARTIWNAMIDRKPAMIARCRTAQDVVDAVRFAREHTLPVAVKGGGHGIPGYAIQEDGFVIDLSEMKGIDVDVDHKTVRVEPGCLLGELDAATQGHGLAVPSGIVSSTGVSGLTLGGGFGWITRKHGLTVDSLLSADIVTADGSQVTASDKENADLFWGIRGGGGNFGVVTALNFRCTELGPNVYCGLIVRPFEEAKDYFRFHREFTASAPEELASMAVMRMAPPLPFLDESVHGKLVLVVAFMFLGDEAKGKKLIEPVLNFGHPHGHHIGMMPFVEWQKLFDPLTEHGAHNYWKSHNLQELKDGAIDTILENAQPWPSPHCEVLVMHLGGAARNVPETETAYAHRNAEYVMNIHTRWETPAETKKCIAWARKIYDSVRPFATGGGYVNFLSDIDKEQVEIAYPKEILERLTTLKKKYDPTNMFRFNQNVKPA